MRVLHVSEALGGGVQSAIANYVDGVKGVEHTLFARVREGQATHDWGDGLTEREMFEGGLAGFFRRLVAKVREERPDIVHLHSSYAGIARAVLPPGSRIVYSPHCYAMERQDVRAPVRWTFAAAEYALARRPQLTVAVSPREAEISRKLNRRNPARVVLNPSPFPPRGDAGREPTSRDIVMVGRILPQKDPALFGAIAERFAGERWRFVWIGDGDHEQRTRLQECGVRVTGWMPPDQVRRRLESAALYLHTAAWEGGPVSAIEAAALGAPVLARGIPSMRSLGYPLAGESADEISATVRRFLTDAEFAARVAESTGAVAAEASKPAMAEALAGAYATAIDGTSRGRPSAR